MFGQRQGDAKRLPEARLGSPEKKPHCSVSRALILFQVVSAYFSAHAAPSSPALGCFLSPCFSACRHRRSRATAFAAAAAKSTAASQASRTRLSAEVQEFLAEASKPGVGATQLGEFLGKCSGSASQAAEAAWATLLAQPASEAGAALSIMREGSVLRKRTALAALAVSEQDDETLEAFRALDTDEAVRTQPLPSSPNPPPLRPLLLVLFPLGPPFWPVLPRPARTNALSLFTPDTARADHPPTNAHLRRPGEGTSKRGLTTAARGSLSRSPCGKWPCSVRLREYRHSRR